MTEFLIDFEWDRDRAGYDLIRLGGKDGQRIVRRCGPMKRYRPLEKYDGLYAVFSNVKTPRALLDFVKDYGPLTRNGLWSNDPRQLDEVYPREVQVVYPIKYFRRLRGDDVKRLLKTADMFRKVLEFRRRYPRKLNALINSDETLSDLPTVRVALTELRDGLQLKLRPESLIEALTLQLVQQLSGAVHTSQCRHCSNWFRVGPGTRRRLDAKFCSDDHRILFNNLKRIVKK